MRRTNQIIFGERARPREANLPLANLSILLSKICAKWSRAIRKTRMIRMIDYRKVPNENRSLERTEVDIEQSWRRSSRVFSRRYGTRDWTASMHRLLSKRSSRAPRIDSVGRAEARGEMRVICETLRFNRSEARSRARLFTSGRA